MIVVTGATGALNGATVQHLLEELPAEGVVAAVRDPEKARDLADRGVTVRRGDYAEPQSLPDAFEGADQLLLVSSNDPFADTVALHRDAIRAAVTAGVGRILYTSHQGASPETPFVPGRVHAETERLLAESGLPWTSLRNGFYLHSLDWLLGPWRETGLITVPADGPVSWTAREDAARAAARVLLTEGAYDGPVTVTAAAAPTFEDIAATASAVSGRTIERVVQAPDDWVAAQIQHGRPEAMARFTLGMYQAAAGGFFAGVDPLLGDLLGHAPQTVEDHLTAAAGGQPS